MSASIRLVDFYDRSYVPEKHAGDAHRTTVATYRQELRTFDQAFRHRAAQLGGEVRDATLADLSADTSYELVPSAMSWSITHRGNARTTANKLGRTINAVWKLAHEKQLVAIPPKRLKYRVDKSVPVAFMPDELSELLLIAETADTVKGIGSMVGPVQSRYWWPAAIRLGHCTMLRRNSCLNLPTKHLNLVARLGEPATVLVPGWLQKGRREQLFQLLPTAAECLRELNLAGRGVTRVLGDWPYRVECFNEHFTRLVAKLFGIHPDDVSPKHKWHALRRTGASEIIAKHGIHEACKVLGHSHISVTWEYFDPRYGLHSPIVELLSDPRAASHVRLHRAEVG